MESLLYWALPHWEHWLL